MHALIKKATDAVSSWTSDDPRELSLAVAMLCRDILDSGELPRDSPDWQSLRDSFDITTGQSISDTLLEWDHWCRHADVNLENREAFVKLGIVTWAVKLLLKKFGMLVGCEPESDFYAWKRQLSDRFENSIIRD